MHRNAIRRYQKKPLFLNAKPEEGMSGVVVLGLGMAPPWFSNHLAITAASIGGVQADRALAISRSNSTSVASTRCCTKKTATSSFAGSAQLTVP
jgi:hypothetical protein